LVMSLDSASSEVTYTSISSHRDSLAWAVDLFGLQEPDLPEAAPASPDYVPVPPYPNYASPVALSPGYVANSDPEEDSKEGPVHYPTDGGDNDDDDSSDDDEEEEEASEEEEHLALADSVIAPVAPMPFPLEAEVERLLALPPLPPSPLISLLPPSAEECLARCLAAPALPSSSLPIVPHPYGSPNHVHTPLGFRASMDRLRASSPSIYHLLHLSPPLPPLPSSLYLPLPIPTSSPLPSPLLPPLPASLFIPPPVGRREDIPKVELPPRKRLCLTSLISRYEVGESSTGAARPTRGHRADSTFIYTLDAETKCQRAEEVSYGIRDVWLDPTEAVEEMALTTLEGVNDRVIELAQEALVSREAWAQSVGLSLAVHQELQAYRTHTHIQDYCIASQKALIATLVAQVSFLQGQLSAALGQIEALQARDPTHADDPKGADSSSTTNNMPPKRTSAAIAKATAAAAIPMTAAAVEQLIEARVSAALANHETI
ncbi:hypothetical protein Tco_0928992, partial [Tanacetum coccineum]